MTAKTKIKKIYVKWLDHYSVGDGWGKPDYSETKDGIANETLGFLVHETKRSLFIAQNYSEQNNNCADTTVIIKACIVKRKFIKL